jgi:copper chaperone CopZ
MASVILAMGGKGLRVLVLTPTPQMHCESCENKIKKNMRFEKGVKKVETNIEKQEVTITYDPEKNNVEGLQKGMKKIGYDTKVVSDKEKKEIRR